MTSRAVPMIVCASMVLSASAALAEPPVNDEVTREDHFEPDPRRFETWARGVTGLRVGQTRVEGASADEGTSVAFAVRSEQAGYWNGLSTFHSTLGVIGGGGAGFEGALQGNFGFGARLPAGQYHGPIARAAFFGSLRGNDAYYFSLIDVPQGQLGWQYLRGRWTFELAGTAGWAIDGRTRAGELASAHLNGLERGAYLSASTPNLQISGRFMRIDTISNNPDSDIAQGSVCANALAFALCGDVSWQRTAAPNTNLQADAFYGGFTVGFATVEATRFTVQRAPTTASNR